MLCRQHSLKPPLARYGDGLDLQVLFESRYTHLTADTTLLVAAEGRVGRKEIRAVDIQSAGADAAGHAQRPLGATDDRARQSVNRIIGDAHGIVVIFVGDDYEYRTKDLLLCDPHVVCH